MSEDGNAPETSTPATHWAAMGESTFVLGMRFLCGVHRWFGRIPLLVFLYPVVFYHWATRPVPRRASMEYLRRMQAAHGSLGHEPTWRDGVRHFLSFADTILDKTLALSGRYRFDTLRFFGREALQTLIDRGEGAVFVTAHVGCLEMCQAAVNEFGKFKLNVLVHTTHAEKFNRVLGRLDPTRAVQLMPVSEITPATAVLLSEKVARGEFIAIAGDRIPVGSGKTVRAAFLGREAPFPVGAYVLAGLLHCPLLLMVCLRDGRAGHAVHIELLAGHIALPRRQRDLALARYAGVYASRLEHLVARAPFEWFNFFPLWDQPHAGPDQERPRHEHDPSR